MITKVTTRVFSSIRMRTMRCYDEWCFIESMPTSLSYTLHSPTAQIVVTIPILGSVHAMSGAALCIF